MDGLSRSAGGIGKKKKTEALMVLCCALVLFVGCELQADHEMSSIS